MRKNKFNRILSFLLGISMISGDMMPALAAGGDPQQTDEGIVNVDSVPDEDIPSEENEKFAFKTGYLKNPGEAEAPSVDSSLSFRDTRAALTSDIYAEYDLDLAVPGASDASASDKAFPCAYNEEWLQYFKDNYPATRDQGNYSSCWAHTAMALAEFNLINHGLATKDIDLSELHTSYWCYNTGTASVAAGDTGDKVTFSPDEEVKNILDNGGDLGFAAQILMHQRGFADESVAPYSDADKIANGGSLAADTERKDSYYLTNAYRIKINDPNNRDKIKGAIIENGAVGVAFYADESCYNETYNSFYNPEKGYSDHNVAVVGWDDDFPASNFSTKPGSNGAWLIRNSWDTEVEADLLSYFWMSYEEPSLTGGWVYELSDKFPYDNHYYYDSTINGSNYFKGYYDTFANIFTVNGEKGADSETLEAVTFDLGWMEKSGTGYKVEVYKDLKDKNDPTSGVLAGQAGGGNEKLYYLGYYTIALDKPVSLNKGETFSVVVTFDGNACLTFETDIPSYGGVSVKVGASEGQSFIGDSEDAYWMDLVKEYGKGKVGNIAISALTKDADEGEDEDLSKLTVRPEKVSFDEQGQKCQLETEVYNKKGELDKNAPLSFESSDENVAKVSDTGLITSVRNGNATITVKSNKLSASCEVSVNIESKAALKLSKDKISFSKAGEQIKLNAIVYDFYGEVSRNAAVVWTSSDETVATVEDGNVTSVASGNAVIRAVCGDVSAECQVTVTIVEEKAPAVSSNIIVSPENIYFDEDYQSQQLRVTVEDQYGLVIEEPELIFLSSDEQVATVNYTGLVRPVASGNAVITVKTGDVSASCNVVVEIEPDEPETVETYTVTFKVDGNEYFKAEVEKGGTLEEVPMDPEGNFLCWVDVDTEAVWNTYSCVFKHMTLNARFEEEETDSAYDTVPDLTQSELYLVKGQKVQLDGSVEWIVDSNYKSYLTVSGKGLLTAKKETDDLNGAALIYDNGYEHYYFITITKPEFSEKTVKIQVGEQTKLDLGIEENNNNSGRYGRRNNYTVAWSSSAPTVATVNGGIVYGIAKGSATISAVVKGKTYKCTVKVSEAPKAKADKTTVNITLAPLQTVNTKASGVWSADLEMTNVGTESKPVYANSVVSVTKAGKVTAIGVGTTILNAPDGRKITVTVNKPVDQIQYINLGKSKTLKFTSVKNANAVWESSDTKTASVEKGKVDAKAVGYVTISCTYKLYKEIEGSGFVYKTTVYVENPDLTATKGISKVKANNYQLNVKAGSTTTIKFTQDNTYAVYQPVVFKSSKPEVAFVDENGVLRAETKGKTKISTKINGKTINIVVEVE